MQRISFEASPDEYIDVYYNLKTKELYRTKHHLIPEGVTESQYTDGNDPNSWTAVPREVYDDVYPLESFYSIEEFYDYHPIHKQLHALRLANMSDPDNLKFLLNLYEINWEKDFIKPRYIDMPYETYMEMHEDDNPWIKINNEVGRLCDEVLTKDSEDDEVPPGNPENSKDLLPPLTL